MFIYTYINDISDNLESHVKLFPDEISIFSFDSDFINTSQKLNKDLNNDGLWSNQWKISFNPDPSKQAQEVTFSRKKNKVHHPPLLLNN